MLILIGAATGEAPARISISPVLLAPLNVTGGLIGVKASAPLPGGPVVEIVAMVMFSPWNIPPVLSIMASTLKAQCSEGTSGGQLSCTDANPPEVLLRKVASAVTQ